MWVSKNCNSDFAISFLKQEHCMFIEFSDLNEVMHELNGSFRDKSVELELAVRKKIGIPSCSIQENKEYIY